MDLNLSKRFGPFLAVVVEAWEQQQASAGR
jgi:hypothetical protein